MHRVGPRRIIFLYPASGKVQGPSNRKLVLLSKIKTLKFMGITRYRYRYWADPKKKKKIKN
jgi:hypothetical protein